MQVMNKRSYAVEIPEVGFVEPGDSIEVDDDLGASLLEQEDAWEQVDDNRAGRPPVAEVLDEVGTDPDKARTALAVEQESDKPRKSLVSRLQEIVNNAEEG